MLFISFVVAPILGLMVFLLPKSTLSQKFFRTRFGVMLEGLKVRERFNIYPLLFFLRRMALVIVTVLVAYTKSLEMLTLFYTNLIVFMFIGMTKIFKDKYLLNTVLFNETVIFHLTI